MINQTIKNMLGECVNKIQERLYGGDHSNPNPNIVSGGNNEKLLKAPFDDVRYYNNNVRLCGCLL